MLHLTKKFCFFSRTLSSISLVTLDDDLICAPSYNCFVNGVFLVLDDDLLQ